MPADIRSYIISFFDKMHLLLGEDLAYFASGFLIGVLVFLIPTFLFRANRGGIFQPGYVVSFIKDNALGNGLWKAFGGAFVFVLLMVFLVPATALVGNHDLLSEPQFRLLTEYGLLIAGTGLLLTFLHRLVKAESDLQTALLTNHIDQAVKTLRDPLPARYISIVHDLLRPDRETELLTKPGSSVTIARPRADYFDALEQNLNESQRSIFVALVMNGTYRFEWFFSDDAGLLSSDKLQWLDLVRDKRPVSGYRKVRYISCDFNTFANFFRQEDFDRAAKEWKGGSKPGRMLAALVGKDDIPAVETFHFSPEDYLTFAHKHCNIAYEMARSITDDDFALFDTKVLVEHDGATLMRLGVTQQVKEHLKLFCLEHPSLDTHHWELRRAEDIRILGGTRMTWSHYGEHTWADWLYARETPQAL